MKKQIVTEDDLLQIPEIDGLLKDIKQQQTVSTEIETQPVPELKPSPVPVVHASDSWRLFLRCSEQYEYRKKIDDRKACLIDNEILETLRNCDINKMSTATLVNSVLRAFIIQNQDILRQHMTRRKTLL